MIVSSNRFYVLSLFLLVAASVLNSNELAAAPTTISAKNSGLCLGPLNASAGNGAQIVQSACDGDASLQWDLQPFGNYYHIVNQGNGLCLNVWGNSTADGTELIQWTCQSASQFNDQWSLVPIGTGFRIQSRNSGKCANIYGGLLTAGAAAIQWPCQGSNVLNDQFNIPDLGSPTPLPSEWSSRIPLSVNPIAVANLPDGRLLMWSAYRPYDFEADIGSAQGQTYTGIFDPQNNTSTQAVVTNTGADMFCPGTTLLPDGRVLVNGGSSSRKTSIYNPSNNAWMFDAQMVIPRGYQGNTLLSNGAAFTLGGSWSGGSGGKSGEVWTNAGGWILLPGVPASNIIGPDPGGVFRGDNHLWLFATSDGYVFHAGPAAQMNWISTAGGGSIVSAGNRGNDSYAINGNAVLYDVGKILKIGGAQSYQQYNGLPAYYASNSAYLIDIRGGPTAPVQVQQLASATYRRAFASAVALPDGSVIVVGGQSLPEPFTDTTAIMVPEIWSPASRTFKPLKPMTVPRTYHSTAILLQDGRVFVGGGGQCGSGCAQNHLDAEILTPPYLLNADGSAAARPLILSAPDQAALGSTLTVITQAPVGAFSLMRLSAITHTVNNDQRRIPLQPVAVGNSTYTMQIPSNPGIVLPGYYMLFAMNAAGVPSVAKTIQIQ